MRTTNRILPLALLVFLTAGMMAAQTTPMEITFGYRFVNVDGNNEEYRSQINEREGFLLRNVTFATADCCRTGGLVDHLRFDASDLGVGPAGALRLEMGRAGLYSLRFFYRRADAFSALPDFANPLFPAVIPGQHTYNRVRNLYDAELDLLPGGIVTPIIGYIRNTYTGPGQTTYFIGQDEFRLSDNLDNTDEEIRAGVAFDAGFITGRVVEGWRKFRSTDDASLAPGGQNGNNAGPVLGVPVTLTDLNRHTRTDTTVDTPSTSAIVTGRLGSRIKIIGNYQRASAEADTSESESLAGSLVSFKLSRFFAGLNETASTKSEATFWRGSGRAEVSLFDGFDLSAGYSRRHRYMDGFALISDLYLNTMTFGAHDPPDLLVLLNAQNSMDRFDDVWDVSVSARGLGPFALRAGWSQTSQDVTVSPSLAEIVVPGGQGGTYHRRYDTYSAGASYTWAAFTLGGDYTGDHANDPIVRTDFINRDRYRLRLTFGEGDFMRVSLNGTQLDYENNDPGINYNGRTREYGGNVEFTPAKPLRLHFGAGLYEANSSIPVRLPETFAVATSSQHERGVNLEGGISLMFPFLTLDASYLNFANQGSYPFTIDRARISGDVPVSASLGIIVEWMRDKYNDAAQNTGGLGTFDANRYGFYIRWRP